MKRIPLLSLLILTQLCFAQNNEHGFELDNGKLYWVKIFEVSGYSLDSLQSTVKKSIITSGLKIINEEKGLIQAQFDKYKIGKQNFTSSTVGVFEFDSNVNIQFKENRYRVELSNMITHFSNNLSYQSRPTIIKEEENIIKRDGTVRRGKYTMQRDEEFTSIFEFKPKRKDW